MIVQFFLDFAVNLFTGLFAVLDFVQVPIDIISVCYYFRLWYLDYWQRCSFNDLWFYFILAQF